MEPIVLIDLIGLQFQQEYNTGRLVLVAQDLPEGAFDEYIFESIVGEPRKKFGQVKYDKTGRYKKYDHVYFDTYAYKKFVANDLLMVCLALHKMNLVNVNMKFLKYGCGFFAGEYSRELDRNIGDGIYMGLEKLFKSGKNMIKAFEFTFYDHFHEIDRLCERYGIECKWSKEDSLKSTHPNQITATTNCADPHSVTGNEMNFSSIDATIGENILSKGFKFSPIINTAMNYEFIDLTL